MKSQLQLAGVEELSFDDLESLKAHLDFHLKTLYIYILYTVHITIHFGIDVTTYDTS